MAWKEISFDSLAAAKELLAAGRWRSCVCRAYYAAYARATQVLSGTADFPEDRDGPSHDDLPDMVFDYLTKLSMQERLRYATLMTRLYEWRCVADYRPFLTVDESLARNAVMQCDGFFKAMEATYD